MKKWKSFFHSPFFMTYSDGKPPAMRHLEGTCRYGWQRFWALMKRRAGRSLDTMGLPNFGVRFLQSASTIEMTGDGVILVLFMHFFTALLSLGLMGRQFLPLPDYISREAKRPGRNPSYAAAHNPWKRRGEDRSLHEIHLSGAPTI